MKTTIQNRRPASRQQLPHAVGPSPALALRELLRRGHGLQADQASSRALLLFEQGQLILPGAAAEQAPNLHVAIFCRHANSNASESLRHAEELE